MNNEKITPNIWLITISIFVITLILYRISPNRNELFTIIIFDVLSLAYSLIDYSDKSGDNKEFVNLVTSVLIGLFVSAIIYSGLVTIDTFKKNPLNTTSQYPTTLEEQSAINNKVQQEITIQDECDEDFVFDDIDIVSPPVEVDNSFITPENMKKELKSKTSAFKPSISDDIIDSYFYASLNKKENTVLEIQRLINRIKFNITEKISTPKSDRRLEEEDRIDYENLTALANVIDEKNSKKIEDYIKKIEFRETAYGLYKNRALSLLLARDYKELGMLYENKNIKQEAFNYFIKSISYYNDAISLMENNGDYKNNEFDIAYFIGQVYQSIGDLQNLDKELRIKSYLMSMCYFKISCEKENDCFNSLYYCGMLYHKLGLLLDEISYIFLMSADEYYTKCLENTFNQNTRENLYKYCADVNGELALYIDKYGKKEGMREKKEYLQRKTITFETSKQLQSNS